MSKKFYFFIGTTTELIKIAPVMSQFEKIGQKYKVITSGQTAVKFDELSFLIKKGKPDIVLGEKRNKSSIFIFLIWSVLTMLKTPQLKEEFKNLDKKNTYFIVHGDPVSSLIGAIIAKVYGLKLVHIESGLRSFNFLEPFPEEICRYIISRLADIHFCPNEWSKKNLYNVSGAKVNTIQNTMYETYLSVPRKINGNSELNIRGKKYFVLIMHRQEHVIFGKEKSKELVEFLLRNVSKNLKCIFITHATTQIFLKSTGLKFKEKGIVFSPRLSYIDFINLIEKSEFLITDGGSNQEEAYYMGLPCLLLRNYTERIEGLGENVVLSKENTRVIKAFMKNYKKYRRHKVDIDMKPSKIVVDYLLKAE